MKITPDLVKELRQKTGAGIMDCKRVLENSDGVLDEAVKLLRKQGLVKAAKKISRETSEGLVASYIHPGGKIGVLVEVNCETDFVAKTADFKQLVKDITMHIAASDPRCIRREEIPQEAAEQEREIVKSEFSNKPSQVVDKIAI
jgi:elongation factor Ts